MNKFTPFYKGCFSQWYRSDFTVNFGIVYFCAEQYMMASKARLFNDEVTLGKIMKSTEPSEIQKLGREIANYDQQMWEQYRFPIVYKGNLAKFSQNAMLKNKLLDTGSTILVEASPVDKIWGVGLAEDNPDILDMNKWQGLNLLWKVLTSVRDALLLTEYDDYFFVKDI